MNLPDQNPGRIMNEMIERVARAMGGDNWDAMQLHGHERQGSQQPDYRKLARAAIAAMREPTDDMIHQGFCQLPTFFANEREDSIVPAWHAMVDAALEEA